MIAVGIDCTSGRRTLTYSALDRDLRIASLSELEIDDVAERLRGEQGTIVAVNSPSRVNAGVVRRQLVSRRGGQQAVRGAEIREAEHELNARGIPIGGTPRSEALAPGWMRIGFDLHRRLERLGFKALPEEGPGRQRLETHPHAGFTALLGRAPLPKPTLEGRLQRALILFERGVRMHDPMAFLEEITRHRLLHGLLPMEQVLPQDQLDALLAAYTAWLAFVRPADVCRVGNKQEGFITLPVPRLLERY